MYCRIHRQSSRATGVANHRRPIHSDSLCAEDGTEVFVVTKETEGRAGKVDGQWPHAREVKIGIVFTQTARDEEGCRAASWQRSRQ